MKKLFAILFSLLTVKALAIDVIVYPRTFTSGSPTFRNVTVTLTGPSGQAVAGPWVFVGDSVTLNTGTQGYVGFSNMLALGEYRLDIAGNPPRSYPFSIAQTNGTFNVVSLIGTNNSVPVFYDSSQINALLSQGTANATSAINSTNFWGVLNQSNLPPNLAGSNYFGTFNGSFNGSVSSAIGAMFATNISGQINQSNLPPNLANSNYFGSFSGSGAGLTGVQLATTSLNATLATNAIQGTNFTAYIAGSGGLVAVEPNGSDAFGVGTNQGFLGVDSEFLWLASPNPSAIIQLPDGIRFFSSVGGDTLLFGPSPSQTKITLDNNFIRLAGPPLQGSTGTFASFTVTNALTDLALTPFAVVYPNANGVLQSTLPGAINRVLLGNGAGNPPTFGVIPDGALSPNVPLINGTIATMSNWVQLLSAGFTNNDQLVGANATNNDNLVLTGLTNGVINNLSNYIIAASANATNNDILSLTGLTNGVINNLSNYIAQISLNATSQVTAATLVITNGMGLNLSNYIAQISLNATNQALVQAIAITNGLGAALSNLVWTIGLNATNNDIVSGINLTNGGLNQLTNYANALSANATNNDKLYGLNATNNDILSLTGLTNGVLNNISNYIAAVAAAAPTLAGNNAFSGNNSFKVLTTMDSLTVTNGFTNNAATPSTVAVWDGGRRLQSLPIGGNQFLYGLTAAYKVIDGTNIFGTVTNAQVATVAGALSSGAVATNVTIYTDQYQTNAIFIGGKFITISNAAGSVTYQGGHTTNSGTLNIGAGQSVNAADGHLQLNANNPSFTSGIAVLAGPETFNGSSGFSTGLEVLDTVSQSGTAGYAIISAVSQESSIGSTGHDLYEGWKGSSLNFNVDSSGNQTNAGVMKATTFYGTLVGQANATFATLATNVVSGISITNPTFQLLNSGNVKTLFDNGNNEFSTSTNGDFTFSARDGTSILSYSGAPYSGDTIALGRHAGPIISGNSSATSLYDQAGAAQVSIATAATTVSNPLQVNNTINWKMPVASKTANYLVLTTDSGTAFNNSGAVVPVTNTLPASAVGLHYSLACVANQNIAFKAQGADIIRNGATTSAAAGIVYSATVGATLHLYCPSSGGWWIDNTGSTNYWTLQ